MTFRRPSTAPRRRAAGLLAAAAALLLCAGSASAGDAADTTVSGGGVTLKSAVITLPSSDRGFPPGPHADAIESNCLACHSAGMVLNQPALSQAEWRNEVTKMVKVFKAPVSDQDADEIVAYLAAMKVDR